MKADLKPIDGCIMKRLKNLNNPWTAVPIADELLFSRMLSLECRRCERTSVPFALMLIDMEDLSRTLSGPAIDEIALAVGTAMRETDITGWYCQGSVIGVILTTLNGGDRPTIESVLVTRTREILSLYLNPTQARSTDISLHLFPEEKPDQAFYQNSHRKNLKSKASTTAKRFIDIAGSLAALLVFFPLFMLIAATIKITSKGPVFFRQKRLGQFGREFTFLKFRSMYVNCDHAIHQQFVRDLIDGKVSDPDGGFKIKDDPRVTPIGRFLRKSSLDELPQFLNVLAGDMSLVGPRPAIPYELESYSLWHRRRILEARPGITGEWQVHGRSRTTFDEMVRMDLRYIRNQSVWLDLKILVKTPFAVLSGSGAY